MCGLLGSVVVIADVVLVLLPVSWGVAVFGADGVLLVAAVGHATTARNSASSMALPVMS